MKLWPTSHRCPWPGCPVRVDPDLWGCKSHWFSIPPALRTALWKAYRRGQTAGTASPEYREAAAAIDAWIKAHIEGGGQTKQLLAGRHGWVTPRADGKRANCGGPGRCRACAIELRELSKKDERQGDLPL